MLHQKAFFNPLSLSLALVTVAIANFPKAAEAAQFNFSYTLSGGDVLSGMMTGDIQADNDTVFVTAVTMPQFNGIPGPDLPNLVSIITLFGGSAPPTVSFSGLTMDFCASTGLNCNPDGFLFDGLGLFGGTPIYGSGPSYGDIFELYNSANWTLTQKSVASVPEPSTVVAIAVIGGGLLLSKRKKVA